MAAFPGWRGNHGRGIEGHKVVGRHCIAARPGSIAGRAHCCCSCFAGHGRPFLYNGPGLLAGHRAFYRNAVLQFKFNRVAVHNRIQVEEAVGGLNDNVKGFALGVFKNQPVFLALFDIADFQGAFLHYLSSTPQRRPQCRIRKPQASGLKYSSKSR